MSNIVHLDFRNNRNSLIQKKSPLPTPTKAEVKILNALNSEAAPSPKELLSLSIWNGACYREIFNEMSSIAEEIHEDPWDVFAVFMLKMNGGMLVRMSDGGYGVVRGRGLR